MKWRLKGQFWMARLAFLAICAFIVADTINLWVRYRIENSFKTISSTEPTLPQLLQKPTQERNFGVLNERNMFGAKREKINLLELNRGAEIGSGRWEDAVSSGLGARLVATAVFPFPQYSLASIESNGNIQSYSINDCPEQVSQIDPLFVEILGPSVLAPQVSCNRFMEVAIIKRIEERRVVFFNERERRYEFLAMDENASQTLAPSRQILMPPSRTGSGNLGETLRKTGSNSYEIESKDFDSVLNNMSQLASQARIVPAFEDGKSIGFKLFNIAPDSLYSKVGLQNGDIVTKINGYEMNSPEKALEFYQVRSTVSQLNVDYKRDGVSASSNISILGRR